MLGLGSTGGKYNDLEIVIIKLYGIVIIKSLSYSCVVRH